MLLLHGALTSLKKLRRTSRGPAKPLCKDKHLLLAAAAAAAAVAVAAVLKLQLLLLLLLSLLLPAALIGELDRGVCCCAAAAVKELLIDDKRVK